MFEKLFGKNIDTLATFPASEGFFGYQDEFTEKDPELLLLLNNDIFYDRSESYRKWFKLTGISKMRDGYKAFINNEIMGEGDRIRGFTVKKITEKKVVLKKNNSSVTLRL